MREIASYPPPGSDLKISAVQAVALASSSARVCVGTFKDAKGDAPVLILDLSTSATHVESTWGGGAWGGA